MKINKKYIIVILVAFILAILLGLSTSQESKFKCTGTIKTGVDTKTSEAFLKIKDYQWWAGLWSNSGGSIWIEIPNVSNDYFAYIKKYGDQLQISKNQNDIPGSWGFFSSLSNTIIIDTTAGQFLGACKPI
jgi:hypothetical protein